MRDTPTRAAPRPATRGPRGCAAASWNEAWRVAAPSGRARRPWCYSGARRGHAAGRGDRRRAVARGRLRPMPSHSQPGDYTTKPIGFLLARRAGASEESRVELETALDADRLTRLVIGPLDIRSLDRLLGAQLGRPRLRPALVELRRRYREAIRCSLSSFSGRCSRAMCTRPGKPLHARDAQRARSRAARRTPGRTRQAALVLLALSRPTVALVAAAAGDGGGAAALDKAAAAGVLEVADGRVRFSHPLLASVVYGQTRRRGERELHARFLAEIVNKIRTSRRSTSPSRRAVPMPRWPRPSSKPRPTGESTWHSAGRSGALAPGANAHAAR